MPCPREDVVACVDFHCGGVGDGGVQPADMTEGNGISYVTIATFAVKDWPLAVFEVLVPDGKRDLVPTSLPFRSHLRVVVPRLHLGYAVK